MVIISIPAWTKTFSDEIAINSIKVTIVQVQPLYLLLIVMATYYNDNDNPLV